MPRIGRRFRGWLGLVVAGGLLVGVGCTEASAFRLPPMPSGVDLDKDADRARTMRYPMEFMNLVKAEGPWDFRRQGFGQTPNPYVSGGNFHYGATARSFGFPEWLVLRAAALKQVFGG